MQVPKTRGFQLPWFIFATLVSHYQAVWIMNIDRDIKKSSVIVILIYQTFQDKKMPSLSLFCKAAWFLLSVSLLFWENQYLSGKPLVWDGLVVLPVLWSDTAHDRMHCYTSVTNVLCVENMVLLWWTLEEIYYIYISFIKSRLSFMFVNLKSFTCYFLFYRLRFSVTMTNDH